MNFEPSLILQPSDGNNADSKTVSVRVMNDRQMTPRQRAELGSIFQRHMLNVRTAVGGYLTRDTKLVDGSPVRIVSNSGMHMVMVWPVGGGVKTKLEDLFFAIPTSYAAVLRSAWNPKYSGVWKFRGKTAPPEDLAKKRLITDDVNIKQHPGNLTWFSNSVKFEGKPVVLSWYGRGTRYGRLDYYDRHRQWSCNNHYASLFSAASDSTVVTPASFTSSRLSWQSAFKSAVWINGVKHSVIDTSDPALPVKVMSAGLKYVDATTLELWIVTYETKLAVYKGVVKDIYDAKPIKVTKQFDINYTIHTTDYGGFLGYSDSQTYGGLWEGLLQPLYFNASCTKLAGLASVWKLTTVNTAAAAVVPSATGAPMFAVLIEVDLVTQATTFTSGGSSSSVRTVVHTGKPPPFTYASAAEARTTTVVSEGLSYGAVDFVGDQLTAVMVQYTRTDVFQEDGSSTVDGARIFFTAQKTMTGTVRTQYRIYRAYDNVTLLEKDSGVVAVGTFAASCEGKEYDTVNKFRHGQESGARTETISAELFWAASIEGGDLRHNCLVVGEFVEVGNSSFSDSYSLPYNSGAGGLGSDPAGRFLFSAGESGAGGVFQKISNRTVTSGGSRLPVLRLLFVKGGVVAYTTPYLGDSARGSYSIFGLIAPENGDPAQDAQWQPWTTIVPITGIRGYWDWNDSSANYQAGTYTTSLAGDLMPSFMPRQFRASMKLGTICPWVSCGRPYVNMFAASPDGTHLFYDLAGAHRDAAAVAAWQSRGVFYIDNVANIMVPTKYHETGGVDTALVSPIYIHHIPEEPWQRS